MDNILIIVSILAGSFAFSTLLYLYFAYNAKPDPEEEIRLMEINQNYGNNGVKETKGLKVSMSDQVA